MIFQDAKRWLRNNRQRGLRSRAASILAMGAAPDFQRAEASFPSLQDAYPPRTDYGYDVSSLMRRAADRAISVTERLGKAGPGLRGLDLGAGDGMTATLLAALGNDVSAMDAADWRAETAKHIPLIVGDCCEAIPFPDARLDFIVSFNTFEHLARPDVAFSEALRVLKPGGLLYLSFNPMFCSPWGLHAYRTLHMPYAQFLFSPEFIDAKIRTLGVNDLGSNRTELQYLNRWKPVDFARLWATPACEVVEVSWHRDASHLRLVTAFPDSFQGRGLTIDDITTSGVTMTLRKP